MFENLKKEFLLRAINTASKLVNSAESRVANVISSAMLNKEEIIVINFKKLKINDVEKEIIVQKLMKMYDIFEHPELNYVVLLKA